MSALESKITTAIKGTAKLDVEVDLGVGYVRKYLTADGITVVQHPASHIMDYVVLFKGAYAVHVQYLNDDSSVVNLIQRQGWKDITGDCFFPAGYDAYAVGLKMLRDAQSRPVESAQA